MAKGFRAPRWAGGMKGKSSGFLKGATNKRKAEYMNEQIAFGKKLKELAVSPPDRHVALAEIKTIVGSEAFNSWYNVVYKLRDQGRSAEYEAVIFAKLDDLQKEVKS